MKEIIDLRKSREKHFKNDDGTFVAYMYDEDVHFLKDGKYEEIDNTLISKDNAYENKNNSFKVRFDGKSLYELFKDTHFLKVHLYDNKDLQLEKNGESIKYINTYDGIDFVYNIIGSKIKENIIIKDKESVINSIDFKIETDLSLSLNDNKEIMAKFDGNLVFQFEVPFMYDANKTRNNNVCYVLEKNNDFYILKLLLDTDWLNDNNTKFPVIIDPTIYDGSSQNVNDTFIYSNTPNNNMGTNNYGKIGVDSNGVYRSLLKFALPTISSDCNIISAYAQLEAYINGTVNPDGYVEKMISIHEITSDWNESTVTWNTFNNSYETKIEEVFKPVNKSEYIHDYMNRFYITNLVKKWYSTGNNYGILLKCFDETYYPVSDIFEFFTIDYDATHSTAMRPYLVISYRKQSGILQYMGYNDINYTTGVSKINNFNGNVINKFYVNKTINSKNPVNLSVIYNSCNKDSLEVFNIAKGWKFNIVEALVLETINNESVLKYIDSSEAVYYFYPKHDVNNNIVSNAYVDEDGLNLEVVLENNIYKMSDIFNNQKEFVNINNIYYLSKIKDNLNSEINLIYTGTKLTKIIDDNLNEININYLNNAIEITSNYESTVIQLNNQLLNSIVTSLGTVSFLYNSNNFIVRITDINSLYNTYEYFDVSPFRFKKTINYSINSVAGKSMEYSYQNLVTTVQFNNGQKVVYTFDNDGHTVNTKNYSSNTNSLSDVYASNNEFIPSDSIYNTKNKLTSSKPMLKYVKNLLKNGDFEDTIDKCNFTIDAAYISDLYSYNGNYSLRLRSDLSTISYSIVENNYYTLSFHLYLNDIYREVVWNSFKLYSVKNGVKTKLDEFVIQDETASINEEFDVSLTGYFESGSTLVLEEEHDNILNVFIDDLQLEKGMIANVKNMVRNSDFSDGTNDWDFTEAINDYSIITLDDGSHALKINSDPSKEIFVKQEFNINGKQGEKFALSFWYKNEGRVDSPYEYEGNTVSLNMFGSDMGTEIPFPSLLTHCKEWQCATIYFTAQHDFESVRLLIISLREINDFYITNIMLCRDLKETKYYYDDNGRLTGYSSLNGNNSLLNYDNNSQLISVFNPKGNSFKYEYDNLKTSRLRRGISPTGITNVIKYDLNNNPVKTIINNTNPNGTIVSGNSYLIRAKGTDKYLTFSKSDSLLKIQEDSCNHLSFIITLVGENVFNISIGEKFFNYSNNSIILTNNSSDNESKFIIQPNNNGSYCIIPCIDYSKCLSVNDNVVVVDDKDISNSNCQFYFEDTSTPLFIENKAFYTQDGRFISSLVDSLGKETKYNYNSINGLLSDSTDANGLKREYTYNSAHQISRIKANDKIIDYQYNSQKKLSKIISGNKEYSFTYDDFLNKKNVKINNSTLITHDYQSNNGNLLRVIYGNGDTINYGYDSFDRINKIYKTDREYSYLYDNFNNNVKINSNNDNYEFVYDLSQKIVSYLNNELKIDYSYDSNLNVVDKKYFFNSIYPFMNISYEYNKDDAVTKVTLNNDVINYNYDYLGRVISSNINNNSNLNIEYYYITKGKSTSLILQSIKFGNDLYSYEYDDLYNITKIYLNKSLINEYKYDVFSELIEENNYLLNRHYKYLYDIEGNLLKKYESTLDNVLIKSDTYEYSNPNWEDQLTKFNDIVITYDSIGNPLTIGNASLSWKNGRELSSYVDSNLSVVYDYNLNGIRTSKVVNSLETKYYLDGSNIVLEQTGNNSLYYIRDNNDYLIGFIYNNNKYYYKKNSFNDIIGIYDNNYNLIATYSYDSWGNIIGIKDAQGNEITDNSNIAHINPFRYRSYYYDKETKLYYLNNRYYNPKWGRFINADGIIGNEEEKPFYNLYTYCGNNPISYVDRTGKFAIEASVVYAVTGLIALGCYYTAKLYEDLSKYNYGTVDLSIDLTRDSKDDSKNNDEKKEDNKVYTVYGLMDNNQTFQYVGRTNNIDNTRRRHQQNSFRKDLALVELSPKISYNEARGLEEYYIMYYKTLNKANKMNNQIHGISDSNPRKSLYMNAAWDYLVPYGETLHYVGE